MSLTLITPPAGEPLDLAAVKAHLRVVISSDDALITALITAARQAAEHQLARSLLPQTWELALDEFPRGCHGIRLTRPPITAISSIKYIDFDGVQQTVDPSIYVVDLASEPARVQEAYTRLWPYPQPTLNAVKIRYTAGWPDAASVPQVIKQWMLLAIGAMYEYREAEVDAQTFTLGFADRLLDPYRVKGY